jgi:hypothetical protein
MTEPLAVDRRAGLVLVSLALSLGPVTGAAQALTYVMISDEDLADQATAIAEVDVLSVTAATDSAFPMVEYEVLVENVLKGTLGSTISIRLPGGGPLDGGRARIAGIPVFSEGQRLLVFLVPLEHARTYGLLHSSLGVFQQARYDAGLVAVRDLREAVAIETRDHEVRDAIRDYDRFTRWLHDRSRGSTRIRDYLVQSAGLLQSVAEPYTLLTNRTDGRNGRWFEFDSGGTVQWFVNPAATNFAASSIEAFVRALRIWSEQPATNVNLAYAGTTNRLPGYLDGMSTVSFGDPFDLIPGQFDCSTGGTLAIGPPLPFVVAPGEIGRYNGVRYHKIVEAEIFVNDGSDCFLNGNPIGAEELFGHELGHTIGIGHSCGDGVARCDRRLQDEALMRSRLHNDRRGARLNGDDLKALSALYGTFDPPTDLAATIVSPTEVALRWKDNTIDEKRFRVEHALGASARFVDFVTAPANSVGAQISSLPSGATIRFRVRAEKRSRWSDWSQIITVQMPN